MHEDFYICIDLGGTNIKTGIVDSQGNVLHKISMPTGQGPHAAISNILVSANKVAYLANVNLSEIAAIGLASPGSLSRDTGMVVRCANLPGWDSVPLADIVSDALGKPVVMENVAQAAAFGEFRAGAGKTSRIRNMIKLH